MGMGMVGQRVAFANHLANKLWVHLGHAPHIKECGFDAFLPKGFQDSRCLPGYRSVIKGQDDLFFLQAKPFFMAQNFPIFGCVDF